METKNKYYYLNSNLNIENVLRNNDYNLDGNEVLNFHKSLPNYAPTKLVNLKNLANKMNIGNLYIKDESSRFGIKAFKGLGASYALHKLIEKNSDPSLTFCTATDGNHGMSLAWSSRIFKRKCVVYVPQCTVEARIKRISDQGAMVKKLDEDYDETVNQITSEAKKNNWVLIQDTSFEGYCEIPKLISTGYLTTMFEIEQQFKYNDQLFDFVFLPSGVGTFASIIMLYFVKKFKERRPKFISVEPISADCCLESMKEGKVSKSKGNGITIMAGLNCGTPSLIAFDILKDCCDLFVAIDDSFAKDAMRTYYNPHSSDERIISGETGASALGGLLALLYDSNFKGVKEKIGLKETSNILVFNTEGDTDPEFFQSVINSTDSKAKF